MHLLDLHAVDLRLLRGDHADDDERLGLDPFAEGAVAHHPFNLRQRARVRLGADDHVHLGGGEADLFHLAGDDVPAGDRQPAQLRFQRGKIQPGVHEGAEDHVATGSGDAVEIKGLHAMSSGRICPIDRTDVGH